MEKYNPCTYLDLARFALVLSVLLSAVVLPAQSSGDFRMMVRRGESWQPLPVDSLGITVEGLGSQVRVTYEMRVFNPFNDVLEGQ